MRLTTLASATTAALLATTIWTSPHQVQLAADATALVLDGTSFPTPNQYQIDLTRDQFVGPVYPGVDIEYIPVTTPQELWPITGVFRVIGPVLAAVDPRISPSGSDT